MKHRTLTCEALESRSVLSATLLWHPLPVHRVDTPRGVENVAASQLGAPAEVTQPLAAVSSRDAALWPFAASSPWNIGIGSGAQLATITGGLQPTGANLNVNSWSIPIYYAKDTDPLVSIYWGGGFQGQVRIPAGAQPDSAGDASMAVIDPTRTKVAEFIGMRWTNSTRIDADVAVINNLTDQGVYSGYHGARAYGGSAIAGLIRKDELAAGVIPHALAVAVDPSSLNRNAPGGKTYVWPANSSDGGNGSGYGTDGNLYMGSLLTIPRSVNVASLGLSPQPLAVARALQDYGAYIVDRGGGNVIYYAEPGSNVTTSGSELGRLTQYLRVVTNNSPTNVNGGGSRFVEPAPVFGSGDPTPDPDPDPTPEPDPPPAVQVFTIAGTVKDTRGRALSNVKVHLFTEAGAYLKTVRTNSAGQFLISEVKPGSYKVATDGGYGSRSWTDKLVTVVDANVLNVALVARRR